MNPSDTLPEISREVLTESVLRAHIAELTRQLAAERAELSAIHNYNPHALRALGLYTGAEMAAHARKTRENERARFTPEEQAAALSRELAQDAAFRAQRIRPKLLGS